MRRRLPAIFGVLLCAATVISLFTGAVDPGPGVAFELPGHWVYDAIAKAAFHIDGSTANIDAQAPVSADPGSQVVQGDTNGYIVGSSRITQFGQSSLSVEQTSTPPSTEIPVGIEATGGPYLVYRNAGQVVRLGDSAVVIGAGGSVGVPVVTSQGTMWLYRGKAGQICELAKDATAVDPCPGSVPAGHAGALTLVEDHPEFVDATANTIRPVTDAGLGDPVPLGVSLTANAVPAPQDVAGKVAILDKTKHQIYLVDPAKATAKPVTIALPPAKDYDGPVSSGSAVAVVDKADNTLLTYGTDGKQLASVSIPSQGGPPRLSRGEDGRVYVDDFEGNDVLVVDQAGNVVNVPVGPSNKTPSPDQTTTPPAPPAVSPPPAAPPVAKPGPPPEMQQGAPPHTSAPPAKKAAPPPPTVPATPPGAPTSVSATAGAGVATVHWGAAQDNRSAIVHYRISWSGGSTEVSGGDREATVSGLTDGTQYVLSVAAINAVGTGPAVAANPVTPVDAAGAPTNLNPRRSGQNVVLTWSAPNLHGGTLQHYDVTATGESAQTTSGTSATFALPASPPSTMTFTVRAITSGADGHPMTGDSASASLTMPTPKITIKRGADSSSSDCKKPDCAWVDVTMTGFAPNTHYSVVPHASDGHVFSDPCEATTDANGDATCNDIRYDVDGETIYVTVQTPDGEVESNHYPWT